MGGLGTSRYNQNMAQMSQMLLAMQNMRSLREQREERAALLRQQQQKMQLEVEKRKEEQEAAEHARRVAEFAGVEYGPGVAPFFARARQTPGGLQPGHSPGRPIFRGPQPEEGEAPTFNLIPTPVDKRAREYMRGSERLRHEGMEEAERHGPVGEAVRDRIARGSVLVPPGQVSKEIEQYGKTLEQAATTRSKTIDADVAEATKGARIAGTVAGHRKTVAEAEEMEARLPYAEKRALAEARKAEAATRREEAAAMKDEIGAVYAKQMIELDRQIKESEAALKKAQVEDIPEARAARRFDIEYKKAQMEKMRLEELKERRLLSLRNAYATETDENKRMSILRQLAVENGHEGILFSELRGNADKYVEMLTQAQKLRISAQNAIDANDISTARSHAEAHNRAQVAAARLGGERTMASLMVIADEPGMVWGTKRRIGTAVVNARAAEEWLNGTLDSQISGDLSALGPQRALEVKAKALATKVLIEQSWAEGDEAVYRAAIARSGADPIVQDTALRMLAERGRIRAEEAPAERSYDPGKAPSTPHEKARAEKRAQLRGKAEESGVRRDAERDLGASRIPKTDENIKAYMELRGSGKTAREATLEMRRRAGQIK